MVSGARVVLGRVTSGRTGESGRGALLEEKEGASSRSRGGSTVGASRSHWLVETNPSTPSNPLNQPINQLTDPLVNLARPVGPLKANWPKKERDMDLEQ